MADELRQTPPAAPGDVLDSSEAGGRIVRGSSLRVVGYSAGLLVGLLSTPLVVRHLGVVDYGRYATVSALIFIVTAITEGGLAALGMREYATLDTGGRERLVRNLLGLRVALTALAALLAAGFALAAGYTNAMVLGTLLLSAGLLLSSFQHTLAIPLSVELRLGWVTVLDLLRQLVLAAVMVILVVAGASLLPFFVAVPIGSAIALAVNVGVVRGRVPLLPSFSLSAWWGLLKQTLLYAAATALGVLYFQLALVLTSLFSTARETGLFGVPFRIVELANAIPWLLTTSAFPVIARAALNDTARLRYWLDRMFSVAVMAGAFFSVVLVIGAPFVIEVVAGAKFDDSITVLRLLGLMAIGTYLIATWAYALIALGAYRGLLVANAVAVVTMGVLTPLLASAHGAVGAAVAAVTTELVLTAAYAIVLMRSSAEVRISLGVVPAVALAVAIAALPAVVLEPPAVVAAGAGGALYVATLLLLRVVPSEITDAVRQILRRR